MILLKRPWEHRTRHDQQLALAGPTSREEYLATRYAAAEELVRLLKITEESRGFELGSGEGIVAREVASSCHRLDCADISRSFLKMAKKVCSDRKNIKFYLIENDYLDFLPQGHFDFGYSLNVFIHFETYQVYHYLISIRKLLKKGGVFFFTGAAIDEKTWDLFLQFADRYYKTPKVTPGYMRWNHLETLRVLIKKSGLELIEDELQEDEGHYKILVRRPAE